MIQKIISGGQSGADFGALLAGKFLGIETGGTAPKGYRTENGESPKLKKFGLVQADRSEYKYRTMDNVDKSDATIVFKFIDSPGTDKTIGYCQNGMWQTGFFRTHLGGYRPVLIVSTRKTKEAVERIREFLSEIEPEVINVAGHRESKVKGIELWVRRVLIHALRVLNC